MEGFDGGKIRLLNSLKSDTQCITITIKKKYTKTVWKLICNEDENISNRPKAF